MLRVMNCCQMLIRQTGLVQADVNQMLRRGQLSQVVRANAATSQVDCLQRRNAAQRRQPGVSDCQISEVHASQRWEVHCGQGLQKFVSTGSCSVAVT